MRHVCVLAAVLVACTASATAIVPNAPAADTPYTEVISTRMTPKAATPVVGWPVLPFAGGVVQTEAVASGFAVVVNDSSVWHAALPVKRSAATTGMLTNNASLWAYPVQWSPYAGLSVPSGARLAVWPDTGAVAAVVSPAGVAPVTCSNLTCKPSVAGPSPASAQLGTVHNVAAQVTGASRQLWIACDAGLASWTASSGAVQLVLDGTTQEVGGGMAAVAVGNGGSQVLAGNSYRLWQLDTGHPDVSPWWEWVTQVSTGAGGPIDDNVTALVYREAASGVAFVGTPSALNIVFANASVTRVSGPDGLPYSNITSLAVAAVGGNVLLHVGTDAGLATADTGPSGAMLPVPTWTWTYKYLERWLPGPRVADVAVQSAPADFVLVATTPNPNTPRPLSGNGLALLEAQTWTLADKVQRMEAIQTRHDRHGLVSDCSLSTFGDAGSCFNHCSDNNGLWTSLVVAAEALRYNITGDYTALRRAWHYYTGMRLLHRITGIDGLIARSAIDPNETHQGGLWTPSKVPAYKGWTWKADASSDEVVGHTFALTMVTTLLANTTGPGNDGGNVTEAAELLLAHADYIVSNGFLLIDFTGKPTTWGRWSPAFLNSNRTWSDERGVNSLEIMALIAGAVGAESRAATPNPDRLARLTAGWATLTNATNMYQRNLLNLKIETPIDDNYSDDELTYLPYYTWLVAALAAPQPLGFDKEALNSVRRTFANIAPYRSDLWNAMTLSIANKWGMDDIVTEDTVDDMLWNLRTWPLELVNWPAQNSHRLDIVFAAGSNRFGQSHTDSRHRILPANERPQGRWNANPHQLDGSDGMSETDGGVWLLPYWLARAAHLLDGPAARR